MSISLYDLVFETRFFSFATSDQSDIVNFFKRACDSQPALDGSCGLDRGGGGTLVCFVGFIAPLYSLAHERYSA